jgi:hypothetical protein
VIGCSEKESPEKPIMQNSKVDELADLRKQPEKLILNLSYDYTELINEDIVLNFNLTIRNTTNDTINHLIWSCTSYVPFEMEGTVLLSFFMDKQNICYTNNLVNKIFYPKTTEKFHLKLKLENKNYSLKNEKMRIRFKPEFGIEGMTPLEVTELYTHINIAFDPNESKPYRSNYILLKDDYKQITEHVK